MTGEAGAALATSSSNHLNSTGRYLGGASIKDYG